MAMQGMEFVLEGVIDWLMDRFAGTLPPPRARSAGQRPDAAHPSGASAIELRATSTDACVGTITEDELQVLRDALEEEWRGDRAYYVDADTVQMLADDRAPPRLVDLLRTIVGTGEGVELYWRRT